MWSTDYPHSETSWPESKKAMDWQFVGPAEGEIRPIIHDNARRFYNRSKGDGMSSESVNLRPQQRGHVR
jgi:hypothetical protein